MNIALVHLTLPFHIQGKLPNSEEEESNYTKGKFFGSSVIEKIGLAFIKLRNKSLLKFVSDSYLGNIFMKFENLLHCFVGRLISALEFKKFKPSVTL